MSQGKTTPTDQAALQWLAQKLETRSRTFRLDQLQATWLPASRRVLYRLLVVVLLALVYGLIGGNLVLGAAIGLVASQIDVESFPRYRLSLAITSWKTLGVMALASSGAALGVGLMLGGVLAVPLSRFGLGLSTFGGCRCHGSHFGLVYCPGRVALGGGYKTVFSSALPPTKTSSLVCETAPYWSGCWGGIIALLLVAPAVMSNQPPLYPARSTAHPAVGGGLFGIDLVAFVCAAAGHSSAAVATR